MPKERNDVKQLLHFPEPLLTVNGAPGLSSVLVLIGETDDESGPQILLTKRTELVETHKGHVSFPGGFWEERDPHLLHTALRESFEEIGTVPDHVEVLGQLQPVITRGSVWIYPFVAKIKVPYPFAINEMEVAKMLYLPVARLQEEGLKPFDVEVGVGKTFRGPGIEVQGELVWGATARMLEQLRQHLK